MTRAIWCVVGWMLLQLALTGPAPARAIELRRNLCIQAAPTGVPVSTNLCDGARNRQRGDWTWLRLRSPHALRELPAGWQLLIDQTRFDRIAVEIVLMDGSRQTVAVGGRHLGDHWAPGGLLRFTVDQPGAKVRALLIGFENLDSLRLMRKVTAASPADAQTRRDHWFILAGLFCGALISAFCYNLVIYTGQRYPFQRWYLLWTATALLYGLFWTNIIALIDPAFSGPFAAKADLVLVGLMIAAGHMFFLSVLEPGMVPRKLARLIKMLALADAVVGVIAGIGGPFSADTTDSIFNGVMLAGVLAVCAAVGFAIRRRSRVIWFYLGGWAPVLCVFGLRLLRNFGFLPQDDLVDMATFAALAAESIALSLAIADRFRLLRQQRDAAEQGRVISAAEASGHRRAALTDFLTGLGNRAAFHVALDEQIALADPHGFMLVLIDVDRLKDVNDRLGHGSGDALLCSVAEALGRIVRPGLTLHRIGGDEFALIAPGCARYDMDRLITDLGALQGGAWHYLRHQGAISLSLGSARYPDDASDGDMLCRNADLALYQAKRDGRRQHHRYAARLRQAIEGKASLIGEAYRSVDEDRFALHFQPLVDILDGSRIGHEALLRWNHPVRGLIGPSVFAEILVADEIGLLIQEKVLESALDALERSATQDDFLCVNFTAAQLEGPASAEYLLHRLAARNIAPARFCIEVTEGIILQQRSGDIAAALHLLHGAGVRIALDDFGTGYASLLHLQQIPADTLKIDRSFIADLGRDGGEAEAIVRAIIGLGSGLGKRVIAEGIETAEQRDALIRLGCRYGQGYLFGRPSPQCGVTSDWREAARAA